MELTLYGFDGQETQDRAVAVLRRDTSGCFIRASRSGDLITKAQGARALRLRDRERGEDKYQWKRCSEGCFRSYLAYLTKPGETHFTIAQREYLHG